MKENLVMIKNYYQAFRETTSVRKHTICSYAYMYFHLDICKNWYFVT